jgi:hypothetical protein
MRTSSLLLAGILGLVAGAGHALAVVDDVENVTATGQSVADNALGQANAAGELALVVADNEQFLASEVLGTVTAVPGPLLADPAGGLVAAEDLAAAKLDAAVEAACSLGLPHAVAVEGSVAMDDLAASWSAGTEPC